MANFANYTLSGVLKVALPLILSSLGWTFMITCDRIMLSSYDINVMNAVVSIGSLLFLFEWSITSITISSEIYAGQYNGLHKKDMVPVATWQMLALSLISFLLFIPSAFLLGKYIIPTKYYDLAGNFFTITMCFLPFSCATAAINGFFVGIKKSKIILFNVISTNSINVILSYILIFGVKDFIEPMGAKGAAIATSIAIVVQFLVIFSIFLSKKYDYEYNTKRAIPNKEIFFGCLKVGVPSSIGMIAEMFGNYILQIIIITMASNYVANHNIALNVFIFLSFFLNGMNKAVVGLAANIIGEKNIDKIDVLLKNALKLHFIFCSIIIFSSIFFPAKIASIYTSDPQIIKYCEATLIWMAIYFTLDGIAWIIAGVLIAGGDTKFCMYSNSSVIWIFKVLPLYLLLKFEYSSVSIGWITSVLSGMIFAIIYAYRYKTGNWLKLQLQ